MVHTDHHLITTSSLIIITSTSVKCLFLRVCYFSVLFFLRLFDLFWKSNNNIYNNFVIDYQASNLDILSSEQRKELCGEYIDVFSVEFEVLYA